MKLATLILGAVALGLCATTAGAAPAKSATRIVEVADLNLNAPADARTLYQRVRDAARDVCSSASKPQVLYNHTRYRACVKWTIAEAVARIDHPRLNEYVVSRRPARHRDVAVIASNH